MAFLTFVLVMLESFQKSLSELVGNIQETPSFLLAVSGGLDSVVMAELFNRSGHTYSIAHCNFGLREKESDEDENFVKELAAKAQAPFYTTRFETEKFCEENKLSIQMGARQLRYDWLEKIRVENKLDYIVTAHHADDAIETFFINLLRGTGISGLHGIQSKNNSIIRPMLHFYRKEIEEFARINNLTWREDSSNRTDKYERNKIRHHLLPVLEEINSKARQSVTATIENLKKTEAVLNNSINKATHKFIKTEKSRIVISSDFFKELTPPVEYLYEIIRHIGFNYGQCLQIIENINGQPGKLFLSATHRLVIDREQLIIEPLGGENSHVVFEIEKETRQLSAGDETYTFEMIERTPSFKIPANSLVAALDFEKLTFPLKIRKWEEGDRFFPLGMKSAKKISDFLVDNKVSLPDKEQVYVLVSDTQISWLIGHRTDERFKITKGTKKVYLCKSQKQTSHE